MKKYIGGVAFIGFTVAFVIGFSYLLPKPNQPTEGIPHNYYHPDVWGHDTIIQDTIQIEDDVELEMNCGDTVDLLSAIMFVESSYNDSAYCKHEDAVGCLQIRQTMVNDINRILKRRKLTLRFTYEDRWSRDKSTQMFEIYCKHYNLTTNEEIARCWNGGPRGINNPATVGYWKKVKNQLNS